MKRTLITVLITVAALIVVAVAAGLAVLYTGAYDVAATTEHASVTRWALNTLQHRSVSARAASVEGAPPTDSISLAHGFEHFHLMCVQCHGAPGLDRGEVGKGMTPTPPRLEEEAHEWSDAELFWITRHGIRLAGMPAFGSTHGDAEIWAIVGFVRRLETMTEQDYATLVREWSAAREAARAGGAGEDPGGHAHAPGTPPHGH